MHECSETNEFILCLVPPFIIDCSEAECGLDVHFSSICKNWQYTKKIASNLIEILVIISVIVSVIKNIILSTAGEGSKSAAEGGEGEGEGGASGSASGGDADGAEGSGGTDDEKKEPKKMSFAERYAGPEGTTVTIKAAPQMPTFPGLPPMEGPSVSIRNPGGGKPPEAVVNFPMPPAFQLLRMMLRRAQQREKEEQEAAAKGEGAAGAGGEGGEGSGEGGASGEGEPAEKKPKKPRLVLRKYM